MIHEIVSSDVEFARGMMDSGHPDTELLAYLATRGLDPAKAAQLVDDLRHGREPSAQLPYELRPASPNACRLNRLGREDFLLGGSILIAGSH
jgi:hypothetical protein